MKGDEIERLGDYALNLLTSKKMLVYCIGQKIVTQNNCDKEKKIRGFRVLHGYC